ncbi:MAG: TolB family protein [Armatimonadota bacterium]
MDEQHEPSPATTPLRQRRPRKARYYVLFALVGCLVGFAVYTYKFRPHPPMPPAGPTVPPATTPADRSPISEQILVQGDPNAHVVYSDPQWSPNGRAIAYVALSAATAHATFTSGDLYLAEHRKGQWSHRLLQKGAGWPVWSPDGAKLAFHQGGLAVMNFQTNEVRLLEADAVDEKDETASAIPYPVSWSPDGRLLLYETAYYEGSTLSLFDFKRHAPTTLTSGQACWIADGRLFNMDDDGYGGDEKNAKITIDDPAKHTARLVKRGFAGRDPFILKDGKTGYLLREDTVYRINIETGKLKKLRNVPSEAWSWSPDGARFAIISSNKDFTQYSLCLGSTTDWKTTVLKTNAGKVSGNWHDRMKYLAWSPDGAHIAYVTATGDIAIVKTTRQ